MRAWVLLLSAAVGSSACGRSQCASFEEPFERPPELLAFSFSEAKRELLLGAFGGAQAHPIDEAGALGRRSFSNARDAFPAGTTLQFKHLALKTGDEWRVIGETSVIHLAAADVPGRDVPIALVGSSTSLTLERVMAVSGQHFVVASVEGELRLGELLADDRVRLVGESLGPIPTSGSTGLKVMGGWDPDEQHFLLEVDDELLVVSREGVVLSRTAMVSGAMPGGYALSWVKLPGGRWSGLQGHRSFLFTPGVRGWDQVIDVGETGATQSATQALDDDGALWIAVPNREGEVVIRKRGPDGEPGPEVRTKALVTSCDTLLLDR